MSSRKQSLLRNIPSVEALLADPQLQHWGGRLPRDVLRGMVRAAVTDVRERLLRESADKTDQPSLHCQIVAKTVRDIRAAMVFQYQKVINATGIVLHTGLGRAVLPPAAMKHIADHLSGYSLLQVDIETGRARHATLVSSGCCSSLPAPRRPRS